MFINCGVKNFFVKNIIVKCGPVTLFSKLLKGNLEKVIRRAARNRNVEKDVCISEKVFVKCFEPHFIFKREKINKVSFYKTKIHQNDGFELFGKLKNKENGKKNGKIFFFSAKLRFFTDPKSPKIVKNSKPGPF